MTQEMPPYGGWNPPPPYQPPAPPKRRRGVLLGIGLAGAGAAAGVIIGSTVLSSAATPTTTASTSTAASTPATGSTATSNTGNAPAAHDNNGRGGGHAGEKALSAALTAKLKAAALKAVPGGTVDRVESDSGDATYEAHMTKSDGSKVTVKFDKNGTVTGVESGMGK